VSGTANMLGGQPEELLHRYISIIDDPSGSWAARRDRIFSGLSPSQCLRSAGLQIELPGLEIEAHQTPDAVSYRQDPANACRGAEGHQDLQRWTGRQDRVTTS